MSLSERARRVVLGDGGAGALVATLLILGIGLVLTYSGTQEIRAAVAPTRLSCAAFLVDPGQAKWVTLEGCRLALEPATSAWWSRRGAGELLIPVVAAGDTVVSAPRLVLATKDSTLVALASSLEALSAEQARASLTARAVELEPVLSPKELRGPTIPLASDRAPAGTVVDGVVVLEHSQEAKRFGALAMLLGGLAVMLFAFWPIARRVQLERELPGPTPPPEAP